MPKQTADERIANMKFASIYPNYVKKVQKKGRTKEELHQVLIWLTGYTQEELQDFIENKTKKDVTFQEFWEHATLNKNASLITGKVCGHGIEDIENPISKQVRYMDKLVDELAQGKKMDVILRGGTSGNDETKVAAAKEPEKETHDGKQEEPNDDGNKEDKKKESQPKKSSSTGQKKRSAAKTPAAPTRKSARISSRKKL